MVGKFLYPFGDGAEVVKQHILILTGKAEISLLCSTALGNWPLPLLTRNN